MCVCGLTVEFKHAFKVRDIMKMKNVTLKILMKS